MKRRIGYSILLLAVTSAAVMAQDGPPGAAPAGDPPSRVARLNFLNGPVSFRPGSVEDWTAASLNYPLTTGDHLWADAGGRAEMHIGSTAVRMDSGTALAILNLDDSLAQFSLTEGAINVRVRFIQPGDTYEVDTPNAAVVLRTPGNYRISANGDTQTAQVIVMSGRADVHAGSLNFPAENGQAIQLIGQDNVQQQLMGMPPPDGFDQWCETRDRREAGMVSARYVPREMIGYEDLDEYGVWRNVPQYGMVWMPRGVAVGWAPYHYGHWAWVEPWGWTWIDDAPWGFAPFHYGRWAFVGADWVWVPGRMNVAVGVVAVRPVYAPALVAFVGGAGFSAGISIGGGVGVAAWFPLGPGEVFVPAYHVSPRYVENINIVHVSNVSVITSVNFTSVHYVNQGVAGAVMVVPHDAFVSCRHVTEVAVAVRPEVVMRAQVVGATAPIAPVRESVVMRPAAGVVFHAPPERIVARQVVVHTAPPPPPVSFAAREQALRANGGRPLDHEQMNTFRRSAPAVNPAVRNSGAPPNNPRPEFNRPVNNDRPQTARPPLNPNQPPARPPVQPQVERPNNPERPNNTNERPNNETRPNNERPNNEARPAETRNEQKAPPKKGNNNNRRDTKKQ